jgi:hypothetical protein
MSLVPQETKIYHITHVDNLLSIIAAGGLLSDSAMIAQGGPAASIGMSGIKQRRLQLPLDCHPGDFVGDYVPFYFCPRSIMLYVISCANNPELNYRGGQEPIVHLESDLNEVVAWADSHNVRWAFSLSNAGAVYAQFRASIDDLPDLNWSAISSRDFRSAEVKEGKQAEFLVHNFFPWGLVHKIGVRSISIRSIAKTALNAVRHHPDLEIRPEWYY